MFSGNILVVFSIYGIFEDCNVWSSQSEDKNIVYYNICNCSTVMAGKCDIYEIDCVVCSACFCIFVSLHLVVTNNMYDRLSDITNVVVFS